MSQSVLILELVTLDKTKPLPVGIQHKALSLRFKSASSFFRENFWMLVDSRIVAMH
jgi:hypothetical protein